MCREGRCDVKGEEVGTSGSVEERCACYNKVVDKLKYLTRLRDSWRNIILYEGVCDECGDVKKDVPALGETWILEDGVTMRRSEFDYDHVTRECQHGCFCHGKVVQRSSSRAVDILINHDDEGQSCMMCKCPFVGPESLKEGVVYDLDNGATLGLQPYGHIAMILGENSEFFDRGAKPSRYAKGNNNRAWKEDEEVKLPTQVEQVKADLGRMSKMLKDAQEVETAGKPLDNSYFPYDCPPVIDSQPRLKPMELPSYARPSNEGVRQKRLEDHFGPQLDKLQESEKEMVLKVVRENYDRFYYPGDLLPTIKGVKMDIQLMPGTPAIRQRPRPVVHAMREKVDEAITALIKQGAVSPITSPWSSPLYPVYKKNGGVRLTVDYRQLNLVTIDEQFPLPICFDLVTDLGKIRPRYFSTFDMTSGFYQIPMTRNARMLSAWSTFSGQYCFNRVAMGLKNSPMVFQRTMERVLRDVDPVLKRVRWYIDDILVVSHTIKEHVELLEKLFKRMREVNLTCEATKCDLARNEVVYLGYQIGKDGLGKNDFKVRAITNYPRPSNLGEVRSFLGLASFFRRFIKGYAQESNALYGLTKAGVDWEWTEECERQFVTLRKIIAEDVTLAYPDFNNPKGFIVQTDGSYSGLGGMLAQEDEEGRIRPIAFVSRSLRGAEARYTVSEIEMLAMVFCLIEFRVYIKGYPVVVDTDHSALVSILKQPSHNNRIQRWSLIMSEFNPKILYKKGKDNTVADAMSRMYQGLDKHGATFEELSRAIRSLQTVEGRSSHPDDRFSALVDSPQYSALSLSSEVPGEQTLADGTIVSPWNQDDDAWAALSELKVVDVGEEVQVNDELYGVDVDVEGIEYSVYSGTSPLVEYDTTQMGYYEEEQECIRELKEKVGMIGVESVLDDMYDGDMDVYHGLREPSRLLKTFMRKDMITDKGRESAVVVGAIEVETQGEEEELAATQEAGDVSNEGRRSFVTSVEEFEKAIMEVDAEQLEHVAAGQAEDAHLSALIDKVVNSRRVVIQDEELSKFYTSNRQNLAVSKQKILYFRPEIDKGWRVFVPRAVVPFLLNDTHDRMGHPSVDRLMGMLQKYVFWRHMRSDVVTHIRRCMMCASRQGQGLRHKAPMSMLRIEAEPFAHLYSDVVELGMSRFGYKYVLTIVDSFTKWVECFPMYSQDAPETTKCMYQFMVRWDRARTLLTDNGRNYTSAVFEKMLKDRGCKHLFCSPFYPQGDGLSERTHRTILNMLAKACDKSRMDWCAKLLEVTMWHNTMPNASTGTSPFALVHNFLPGIVPGSPYMRVSAFTAINGENEQDIKVVREVFDKAVEKAVSNLESAMLLRKRYYDKRSNAVVKLVVGQRVFRHYPPASAKRVHKLARVYLGPLRLIRLRENGSALVKRVDDMSLPPARVNVSHLTHCYFEVPTNKYWDGNRMITFKPNELSVAEVIQIKPEWLPQGEEDVGSADELEEEAILGGGTAPAVMDD